MSGSPTPSPVPTRKIACLATSAAAHVSPLPDDDDPLLAFAPYLHKQPRRNSITPDLERRFVARLAASGIVKQAARSIGKIIEALYKLRARPGAEGFAAAWDAALRHGTERLEDCALERALKGGFDDDPVSGWGGARQRPAHLPPQSAQRLSRGRARPEAGPSGL